MINFVNFSDINEELELKLKNFILLSFPESRLYTYESIVYFIDNDNNDDIIGFTGLNIYNNDDNDIILINQLCVCAQKRNKGIATKLLEFIENKFKNNKNNQMILYVRKYGDNVDTECLYNFYTKRGFIEVYSDKYKYKLCKQIQKELSI